MIIRLKALVASLALCSVALTACGASPSATYTGADGSYLRLPGEWNLFDGKTLLRQSDPEAEVADGVYLMGFALEADDPSAVLTSNDTLTGMLLSSDIPDGSTPEMDRNVLISNLGQLLALGTAQAVEDFSSFDPGGTAVGERAVIDINDASGEPMRLLQMIVTNEDRSRIWVLAITCTPECFTEQKDLIENIATTWKVDTKR